VHLREKVFQGLPLIAGGRSHVLMHITRSGETIAIGRRDIKGLNTGFDSAGQTLKNSTFLDHVIVGNPNLFVLCRWSGDISVAPGYAAQTGRSSQNSLRGSPPFLFSLGQ